MCSILAYCSAQADPQVLAQLLARTISRGPDDSRILETGNGYLGFNRLSIMGLTPEGMQPFVRDGNAVVCNGELYGFRKMREALKKRGYSFQSDSDCEILLPMYREFGLQMFRLLDAEFAMVLYDAQSRCYIAARDPVGIRPLYYGQDRKGIYVFSSEPKSLVGICERIMPFPPGHYAVIHDCGTGADDTAGGSSRSKEDFCGQKIELFEYRRIWQADHVSRDDMDTIAHSIHDKLIAGIEKRLDADAPVGFLLSGGLDSSLVCGAAAKILDRPLQTFAIGMDKDAIDLKYARQVADYIHSDHHEVIMTREDVLGALDDVIAALGTWDITTVRASMGMYLVCKWIHENTDIRVILTGEISDEIFGYKYTDFAPDAEAFQEESEKRIREIHMYDVLRADRCISVHSLEARVPFGDLDFLSYCMAIDPEKKLNRYGIGKYLLRHAFEEDALIPQTILMREKAAFSDAVGHSMRRDLMDYAEALYTDGEYEAKRRQYSHAMPFTKESLLYREIFEKHYPGQAEMVVDFWMPNRSWEGCDVNDPSASVLPNYGASGI
ncbi:MAG: asparagine synthase B [Eubacteriales bacterium]|nr:asparagine synthase B [Sarcina sp.]MBR2728432.1 asparagine synthase B [Lachnospiraceae bacterium]MDO4417051.1 asparagine synthase B [Eubacteriales bacterium]